MGNGFSFRRWFEQLLANGQKLYLWRTPRGVSDPPNFMEKLTKYQFYWRKTFDGRIRYFDEIPGPEPSFADDGIWRSKISGDNIETIHQTLVDWIKQYGHVVREYVSKDRCIIHLLHPEDMCLAHMGDPGFKLLDDSFVPKTRCRKHISKLNACNWLVPSANTEWKFLSMPPVFGREIYDSVVEHLEDIVNDFFDEIKSRKDKHGEIDILPSLFRWAFESLGLLTMELGLGAFSEDQHSDAKVAIQKLKTWKDTAYRVIDSAADDKKNIEEEMKESKDFLFSYFEIYVQQIIDDPDSTCVVKRLYDNGWDQSTLATFLMDFYQHGVHKLSYHMAHALMNIAADSSFQNLARADLKKLSPSKDSEFYTAKEKRTGDEDVWTGSWYIRGLMEESLRLNPAIYGSTEIAPEGLILGGYDIPEGAILVFHHDFVCRQEPYFPDPLKFNPKRFIPEAHGGLLPTMDAQDIMYLEYIMTYGSTICVMEAFNDALVTLLMSKMIRNFQISRDDEEVKIVRTFFNDPVGPIKLKLKALSRKV